MSVSDLEAILYQRLDLIDYAEAMIEKIKTGEKDESAITELSHIIGRLRVLRTRLHELITRIGSSNDVDTLLSYYKFISAPKEQEVLSTLLLLDVGDDDFKETVRKDLDDLSRLLTSLTT
ncbi:MAG: hypothetical protein GSR76_02575 [Desulfurococcales archaeon]|nr:hypothetical protein [Desulfurococcales archaeon]